ncbi:Beta-lactamase [Shewanella psychrophila]|uniref:Beta-lactamase n=1 Tax=Shewanella psychrophila TaxID=225848 RepID=A0A1S6HVB8_9GAMM|nr:serine hydrolase domain-containing protein [Shewanella psychrophila]AQS39510.1 Beta-lactamase [Shewanella psychrophila]
MRLQNTLLSSVVLSALALSPTSYADFPSLKNGKKQAENSDGQTKNEPVAAPQSIEISIKQAIDTSQQPFSGSLLLLKDGKPLLTVNKGRGITRNSSFVIASLSKQITATLILQAVDADKLDLRRSINSYLIDGVDLDADEIQGGNSDAYSDTNPEQDEGFSAKFETAPEPAIEADAILEPGKALESGIALDDNSELGATENTDSALSLQRASSPQDTSSSQQAISSKTVDSPTIIYGIDVESARNKSSFDPHRYNENITLHHLLSHTSGVSKLGKPNRFEPGSQFQYSNFGYSLLGEILEQVNQQTLAQQIADFKLNNQLGGLYAEVGTIDDIRQRAPSLTIGLTESGGGLTPSGIEITESLLPAGGLIATTKAFAAFQRKLHSGRLISPQSYQLMTSSHTDIEFLWPDMSYGYGLRINREDGITEYSHTGYLAGYMSMTLHYPEFNLDLVMLENISLNVNDLDRVFELHNQIRANIRESLIYSNSHENKKLMSKKDK